MIRRIDNIKFPITLDQGKLKSFVEKKYKTKFGYFKVVRKSLDARDKRNIFWLYSVAVSEGQESIPQREYDKIYCSPTVAVIGGGPAGLFCAIRLVQHGFRPIIIERGECVEDRRRTCLSFFAGGPLNESSNVQFGEGGAGAFSDGKLNTRTKDSLNGDVIDLFVRFGAPQEVAYLNKPHVGSDKLFDVLRNIRAYIEQNGGKYLFNTRVDGLVQSGGELKGLLLTDVKGGGTHTMQADAAVLAIGHSARDTFEMLSRSGVYMQPREFAVGVRIEHLAADIGRAQYGESFKILPTADYQLVSHAHERTAFTFCMCPGGVVMPATSEEGAVVVNGMSLHARDGENSNSALMVQMKFSDFGGDDLFAGVRFQREIERRAFIAGGGNYHAPVQLAGDFLKGVCSHAFASVKPTYAAGTTFAPMDEVLPPVACSALRAALPDMGRRLRGFDNPHAVLTGAETRFSSPVKIVRGEDMQSVSLKNLYPCGEGSGYSGGITSSAADGMRVAETLFARFSQN